MHIVRHLVPWDVKARAVGAEDGARRIFQVRRRVIADGGADCLRIMARGIAVHPALELAAALGIGRDLPRIAPHRADGGRTGQRHRLLPCLRRIKAACHALDILHRPAQLGQGELQPEGVDRRKQHALCLHQALADRPPGRLAKVAAFGMLEMGAARF